eukprot:3833064-Karenia_brevis.AAC.1
MLNDADRGVKNTEVDAHAIWDMFFQGKEGLSTEFSDGCPHYGVDEHIINAGPTRPGGDVMFVTSAVI